MARAATRELAFRLIFQADYGQHSNYTYSIENFARPVDQDFLRELVDNVLSQRDLLDQVIAKFSRGWSITRMPRVERAILRLAAWELLFSNTPPAVVINEAVNLAKDYSNAQAASFVNGVLDSIRAQGRDLVPQEE